MSRLLILFLILIPLNIAGQAYSLAGEIGHFKGAENFDINASSGIFVATANEIIKIDTLGKKLKEVGGYGWSTGAFDEISDIFVNTLQVIVADKNNDRIQIFDKDLNFLSEFNTFEYENENYTFRYPQAVAISGIGDMYILDSENRRILKYNLSGEFQLAIGSYDAGDYQLVNPVDFITDSRGNIFAADENFIVMYDQYGTGLRKLDSAPEIQKLRGFHSGIITISSEKLVFYNLLENKKSEQPFPDVTIRDAKLFHGKLYLLTPEKILVYQVTQ